MASILARSRPTLATATFRTPRLHRAGARPVQGVLSRLITRTRISSDREGCRVGVAQLDCAPYYNSYFTQLGVVYFAASGDTSGVIWPSTSPNVVSVGGTSISRNPTTGNFQQEMAWQSGGGGPSAYKSRPGYQNGISAIVQSRRGTPDVAADADPSTGVWVYAYPNWYIVGGTSVSAPVWVGVVNSAGSFAVATQNELGTVYANFGNAADFADTVHGSCGPNQGYLAGAGWDFCTGVGSPVGKLGK